MTPKEEALWVTSQIQKYETGAMKKLRSKQERAMLRNGYRLAFNERGQTCLERFDPKTKTWAVQT